VVASMKRVRMRRVTEAMQREGVAGKGTVERKARNRDALAAGT